MAAITRLGLYGCARAVYGVLTGKAAIAPEPEVDEGTVGGGGTPGIDRDDEPDIIKRIQRFLDAEKGIKPTKTKTAKTKRAKRASKIKQVEIDLKLFQNAQPETAAEKLDGLKKSLAEVDRKLAAEMRAIGDEVMIGRILQMYDDDLAILLLLAA